MTLHVMLYLDYSDAKSNRDDFYAQLEYKGWVKLGDVDTVWVKTFGYTTLDTDKVEREITAMMKDSVTEFKPTRLDYVAQIGNNTPIERAFIKKNFDYEYVKK